MRFLLVVGILLFSITTEAQVASRDLSGLTLLHRQKKVTKTIPYGSVIVCSINDEKVKGVLESIDDRKLSIDGVKYQIADIDWIGLKSKWTTTLATVVIIGGLGIATSGVVYLASASGGGIITSALIISGGVGFSSIGIPLFKHGKRHYLGSDWKVLTDSSR
ncbi:MAG: hypothetical protein HKN45_00885 [Flavobacteriales bacterium]|nr:hypothetical protein [Flavobacteriales bacterium]